MNKKLTGLRFASVILPAFLTVNLSGCGTTATAPTVQAAPVVQAAPIEEAPVPEEMTAEVAASDNVASSGIMRPDYPERYVVVKGDTLWDISKRFLKDPWMWPSVWHINPEIRNPHLIYPGDVIVMFIVDGKPYITLDGQAGQQSDNVAAGEKLPKSGLRVVKLSPSSRISGIHKAIATIPASAIKPFLDRPRVVTEEDLEDAPYIVSSYEGHLISGTGNRIYARNIKTPIGNYNIVRPGSAYIDPDTDEVLGYEAIYLADAHLIAMGEDEDQPSTLTVTKAKREILNNDVLIPYEKHEQIFQFTPHAPERPVKGQIISVFNGVSQIGQFMVVVLNRGKKDGLVAGHVLAVIQKGVEVRDSQRIIWTSVNLPDERAGVMMVFRSYENVSYALVMEAQRPMHILDRFENP